MKLQYQHLLYAFAAAVIAAPTEYSPSILHEKRYVRPGLERGARIDGTSVTSFRIALKQRNLENGYDYLMSVSHPSSSNYGKLWTADEVRNTFAPSEESIEAVRSWLGNAGIKDIDEKRGWLVFETTIAHAEELLGSEYYEHEDLETGAVRIGCDEYHLPEHISRHVDYVTPGIALSAPLEKKSVSKRSHPRPYWPIPPLPHHRTRGHHQSHSSATSSPEASSTSLPPDLQNCGKKMTPDCIRALYDLPSAKEVAKSYSSDPVNAVGVFETGSIYIPKDLDRFFKKFAPYIPAGTRPKFDSIEDASLKLKNKFLAGEANIDLDIIYSLTYPQTITLYQVLPKYNGKDVTKGYSLSISVQNLLDAIDQSFCSDKDKAAGQDCGIYSPTRVISISYGASEVDYPIAQQQRQCHEFLKLGLQGHTFTIASGDYGVAAQPSFEYDTNGCIIPGNYKGTTKFGGPTLNGTVFNPIYPQNCPYVLSVGGTQLKDDETVLDPEVVMYQPSLFQFNQTGIPNVPTTFSTSGGFSNYFSRPSYQIAAVDAYFASHDPGYLYYTFNGIDFKDPSNNIGANGGKYNRAGRGTPDVSANGAKLQYYLDGQLGVNYGTSLAAPIWASVITLLNEKRAEYGKGPVGFINPVLYEHPEVFHDITQGKNPGCGTDGYQAVEGWDPVTGLGTPDFPKLLDLFLKLP